ncbi:putative Fe-S protein [Xenococcus sp. PCC 7305]|uniref:MOSC domain-containing protein n=1 Tax=Xenococcus sp. PCC 7305 TaxID=102125 RepID=UPI0002AC8F37|nr:MOSC domain-containing protein [Xenococcus sp. PCC 7305]ELS05406.1 putative Fe-S protein [Xenococcus sp. PCC 7305]
MKRTFVGSLKSLWRYPVKSMQGEKLDRSDVGAQGLFGDRAYALWDEKTNRIASAKNPQKWSSLLNCYASLKQIPQTDKSIPPVHIKLPNGSTVTSEQAEINTLLSQWLDREIKFLSAVPEAPSLDQYWPDVEGTDHQDTVTQLFMPPGTFFDSCPIHAITTATLDRLQELYPTGQFDSRRFRPNLLIDTQSKSAEFIENAWVGQILSIGDSVSLKIDTLCPRCVVTTLEQPELPKDLNILKTTAKHNKVIAGIRLSVIQGGTIRQGDSVWLEADKA